MDRLTDPDFAFPLVQKIALLLALATVLVPVLRQRMRIVWVITILYGGALVLAIALAVAHFLG